MIIALVGPTGSGKTELGIKLADRFRAEIINADSRQVYRGLDIGSAKPTLEQRARVPHHLVDIVAPDERFDVAQFRDSAEQAIAEIQARRRNVLVVGGTGLYIKVLREGLFAGPSRNEHLRTELEREEQQSPGTLHRRLREIDPQAAARLHPNDRVRLVRAIEVYVLSGRTISDWQQEHAALPAPQQMRTIVLDLPRDELYRRIETRCHDMLDAGFVEEVRALFAAGYSHELSSLQSLGYREIGVFVRGGCTLEEAVKKMAQATRNFAKRQITWFRGDRNAVWLPPDPVAIGKEIEHVWCGEMR